jgi:SAM-dependent methyltransferase
MTRLSGRIYTLATMFGIDTRKTFRTLKGLRAYFADLRTIKRQHAAAVTKFQFGRPIPCLDDRFVPGGSATGHYFHQDLLVARRVHQNNPDVHMDAGSRVDGFVAHVASFRSIVVLDIRPLVSNITNIEFIRADLMSTPSDRLVESCDSLSCLHALEHFGLGRYGDPVRYDGHLLGLQNLHSLLRRGGKFYLSVPIGPQRIEFNAHRVFSVSYLLECLTDQYHIDQFSFVDDNGNLHEHVSLTPDAVAHNFGCYYGCGIIEMTKI